MLPLRIDRRMVPEEMPETVERDLVAQIAAVAARLPGVTVRTQRILLARPLQPQPGHERLVSLIQRHARTVLGEDIPANGVPLYTDARLYSAAGIPTVLYGAGPRSILEANAHSANEHIKLSDLKAATKIVEATLRDLLRG